MRKAGPQSERPRRDDARQEHLGLRLVHQAMTCWAHGALRAPPAALPAGPRLCLKQTPSWTPSDSARQVQVSLRLTRRQRGLRQDQGPSSAEAGLYPFIFRQTPRALAEDAQQPSYVCLGGLGGQRAGRGSTGVGGCADRYIAALKSQRLPF